MYLKRTSLLQWSRTLWYIMFVRAEAYNNNSKNILALITTVSEALIQIG